MLAVTLCLLLKELRWIWFSDYLLKCQIIHTLQTLVNGPHMGFEWVSHKFMGILVCNMISTCLTYERTTWSLMGKKYVNSHIGIISLAHKLSHFVMTMWDTYGIDKATPYAKLNIQKTILRWAIHIGSTWLPINKRWGCHMG